MHDNRRTQAERSAETRESLIAAGRALFAEHGFADVALEAIVRAAGVTRRGPLSPFPRQDRTLCGGV